MNCITKVNLRAFMVLQKCHRFTAQNHIHRPALYTLIQTVNKRFITTTHDEEQGKVIHATEGEFEPPLPPYQEKEGESIVVRRARLMYQSRKRGMLENDLLLSSFAAKYLDSMTESQLRMYDLIINKPSNDWNIFYWLTGKKEVPEEFNNEVMRLMIEHCKNRDMENRTRMPELNSSN